MVQDLTLRAWITLQAGMQSIVSRLRDDERGQDTLEWVMLSGLVAIAIVAVGVIFKDTLNDGVTLLGNCLDLAGSTTCNPSAF